MRKLVALLCALTILISLCAEVSAAEEEKSNDIVILYTNDVHTNIDGPLSYDTISAIKKELKKKYRYVLLVDAGDHLQGTAYGSVDKGASIVQLMNAAGYDIAIPGNHEFDYGVDTFLQRKQEATYNYICCNFFEESDGIRGNQVLDSFCAYHFGKEIVAFIGIATPETITSSTPAYFQDDQGNYCYGFSGGNDGQILYRDVQAAIDSVRRAGATKVIAIGHLGDDASASPWTSEEVIAHVSGLDAFIDGHSHSVVKHHTVPDADGKQVELTQTGEYLSRLGIMVIDYETGEMQADLIECEEKLKIVKDKNGEETTQVTGYRLSSDLYPGAEWVYDYTVGFSKDKLIKKVDLALKQKIGETKVVFDNYDDSGTRLVRCQETNTGDFAADALYYLFDSMGYDVDAAVVNGGGIRNNALKGVLNYKACKSIHTFGNVACLQTVTGQQLLDALEWGAQMVGSGEEFGGFLQVSGVHYQIDADWPDSTRKDDKGMWIGGPTGGYRVHSVEVYDKDTDSWLPLDVNGTYQLAGYNYILRDLGNGFNMFGSAVNVVDYVMEDYLVLANYVKAFDQSKVSADNSPLLEKYPNFGIDYGTVAGSGRILLSAADRTVAPIDETTEPQMLPETTEAVPETQPVVLPSYEPAPFPVLPLIIAAISCIVLIILLIVYRKGKVGSKN